MQALSHSLMAGLLLIQAVTGMCCNHPCFASCHETTAHAESGAHDCCHEEGHECPPHHDENAPCQDSECHGFCTYVTCDRVEVEFPPLAVTIDLATVAELLGESQSVVAALRHADAHPSAVGPPLRLHLLHQIILI